MSDEKRKVETDIKGHRHYWGENLELHSFEFDIMEQHKAFKRLGRFLDEQGGIVHSLSIAHTESDDPDRYRLLATVSY